MLLKKTLRILVMIHVGCPKLFAADCAEPVGVSVFRVAVGTVNVLNFISALT